MRIASFLVLTLVFPILLVVGVSGRNPWATAAAIVIALAMTCSVAVQIVRLRKLRRERVFARAEDPRQIAELVRDTESGSVSLMTASDNGVALLAQHAVTWETYPWRSVVELEIAWDGVITLRTPESRRQLELLRDLGLGRMPSARLEGVVAQWRGLPKGRLPAPES